MEFATYKKAKVTRFEKGTCFCCSKELNTINIIATSIDGKPTNEEVRLCMNCLSKGGK
jgi:hypothetical protein